MLSYQSVGVLQGVVRLPIGPGVKSLYGLEPLVLSQNLAVVHAALLQLFTVQGAADGLEEGRRGGGGGRRVVFGGVDAIEVTRGVFASAQSVIAGTLRVICALTGHISPPPASLFKPVSFKAKKLSLYSFPQRVQGRGHQDPTTQARSSLRKTKQGCSQTTSHNPAACGGRKSAAKQIQFIREPRSSVKVQQINPRDNAKLCMQALSRGRAPRCGCFRRVLAKI